MSTANSIKYTVLAILLGEVALVLLTTFAQEVLYNGIGYFTSSQTEMVLGGLATITAAVIAGIVAAAITKASSFTPHIVISLLIIIEMTYLLVSGKLTNPNLV